MTFGASQIKDAKVNKGDIKVKNCSTPGETNQQKTTRHTFLFWRHMMYICKLVDHVIIYVKELYMRTASQKKEKKIVNRNLDTAVKWFIRHA